MRALQLDHVKPIEAAARQADRLSQAICGLTVRYAASRFRVSVADVYSSDGRNHDDAALALDAAIYMMRVGLEFSQQDLAALFMQNRKRVARAVERIEERRDGDAALDSWLSDLENAMKGAIS